jgi:virginiamycin A acetyltransferase
MTVNNEISFNNRRDNGLIAKLLIGVFHINSPLMRSFIFKFMWKYLGKHHQYYSITIRKILKKYYDVEIGLYSYGGCFLPNSMTPRTTIGRYCSIAYGVGVYEDFPINFKSTHPFFFNSMYGYMDNPQPKMNLAIGNDVWIGQNTTILPGCSYIGNGAIIGAGSVVTKDIPPYAIAVGNPCKVIQYRFSKEKIEDIQSSKWWEKSMEEIANHIECFKTVIKDDDTK